MRDKTQLLTTLRHFQVIQFGSFITKSGRPSSFFFNTGNLCSGGSLGLFAEHIAAAIAEYFPAHLQHLFGPAYKGIALAAMVADRLEKIRQQEVFFTFNRKEIKTHGEGSELVGYRYRGGEEVIIVEDVLTAGTSIRESIALLQRYGVRLAGIVVGIDRQEQGRGELLAREELMQEYSVPVHALLSSHEILRQ
jgi:orotate phosphoribosyltransferase